MHERRLVALLLLCALAIPGLVGRRPGPPQPPTGPERPRADAPLAATLLFGGRLDLNRASAGDLAALPGIGPARARHIAAWRARHGRFQRVEELAAVPGIGPRTVGLVAPSVACGD